MKKIKFTLSQISIGGVVAPSFYSDEIETNREFTISEILGGITEDCKKYIRRHKKFNCKLINCSLPVLVKVQINDKIEFDSLTIQRKRKLKFDLRIGYSFRAINKFGAQLKEILIASGEEFKLISLDEAQLNNAIEAIESGVLLTNYSDN